MKTRHLLELVSLVIRADAAWPVFAFPLHLDSTVTLVMTGTKDHDSRGSLVCCLPLRRFTGIGIEIICIFCSFILSNQICHNLLCLVKLVQIIGKRGSLLVTFHESIAFPHAIILPYDTFEELDFWSAKLLSWPNRILTVAMLVWFANIKPLTR
jgi:hypothetical protein